MTRGLDLLRVLPFLLFPSAPVIAQSPSTPMDAVLLSRLRTKVSTGADRTRSACSATRSARGSRGPVESRALVAEDVVRDHAREDGAVRQDPSKQVGVPEPF